MNSDVITALVLGLVGGMIPGPVLAAIFTEILQSGFIKSLRIVFLAMITETIVALSCLLIVSSLNFSESIFNALSIIGAGILMWIATSIWKISKIDTKSKVQFSFGKISAMILANGVLWTFWITVCIPKAIALNQQISFGSLIFLGLVEIGWLLSTALVAFIFSQFRSLLSKPKVIPLIFKFFALTFVYFALGMAIKSIHYFKLI